MRVREAIATGLRRATRWRLLLLCAVLSALPAAVATLPLAGFLSGLLSRSPELDRVAAGEGSSWIPDLLRALAEGSQGGAIGYGFAISFGAAFLLGPALAGAVLAEAGSEHPLRFRPLLTGAGAWYGRMLRTSIVSLVPLGVAGALVGALSRGTGKAVARMTTEGAAASRVRLAFLVGGLLLVAAHLTADAARARLAASPERRSALLAWLSGTWLVLRHPLRTGAATLAGLLCGPAVAFLLLGLRERLPGGPAWAVVAGVLLAQLAAAAVGWGRAVRLVALTRIARGDREARHAPAVILPGA